MKTKRKQKTTRGVEKEMLPELCGEIENSQHCVLHKNHNTGHKWEMFNRCGVIENGLQCRLDASYHAHQPCYFGEYTYVLAEDDEFKALAIIVKKLQSLDTDAKLRVIAYVDDRFGQARS